MNIILRYIERSHIEKWMLIVYYYYYIPPYSFLMTFQSHSKSTLLDDMVCQIYLYNTYFGINEHAFGSVKIFLQFIYTNALILRRTISFQIQSWLCNDSHRGIDWWKVCRASLSFNRWCDIFLMHYYIFLKY